MKINSTYTKEEIQKQIRIGDYVIISKLTNGKYTAGTVRKQIRGPRTLKQPVADAAQILFESREKIFANK